MPAISPTLLGNVIPQNLPEPQKIDNNSWSQVSAFNNFTSGIRSNSLLFGWGTNNVYQAGDGTTINKSVPTQISTSSFSLTSSGFDHSAALTIDNRLFVWGNQPSIQTLTSYVSWSVISRAGSSAIGIRDDGKLYTWGNNAFGQVGDGTTINKSSPVQIGNSSWSSVAAGELTSLAITVDGRLFAWGYNDQGMIGDNTVIRKSSPVQITAAGVSSWSTVSAGYRTAYAIDNTGKLFAWGLNSSYQIGDTTQTTRLSPTQVATGTSWTQVSGGADHAAAINALGQVYVWGNFAGAFAPIPTTIYSWSQICGGGQHTIALDSLNQLYTWGQNTVGQLGDGTTLNKSSPIQIGSNSYAQVSGNYSHSLALRSDGTVWAWGLNNAGQLGNNTTLNRSSPIQLGSSTNYSFVNVGASNSIAIDSLGQLFIWGDNSVGQLGQLGTINRSSPTQLGNLFVLADVSSYLWPIQQNAVSLSTSITPSLSGSPVSIYFNGSTSVYNPGSIGVTQVSDGRQSTTEMWVRFDDLGVNRILFMLSWRNATLLQDGGATGILVNRNANNGFTVFTAQGSANQTTSTSSNNLITSTSTWYHIAVQIYFQGCDIYLNGTRVAQNLSIRWPQRFGSDNPCDITIGSRTAGGATNTAGGSDFLGYISNIRICKDINVYSGASFTVPTAPLTVTQSASTNISAITLGQVITLTSTDSASVLNAFPVSWTQASSGSRFSVALKPDASLWAWGLNSSGQLGQVFSPYPAGHTFNRSSPVLVAAGSWLQISAGFDHVLAIRNDFTLWTWGNYLAVSLETKPTSWLTVSGGATHTLGIDNQGKLYAWGSNTQGQLGVLDAAFRSSPTQVSGLLSWTTVAAGNSFSLAINNTNQLYGWGFNTSGQAGDGTSLNKSSPILIGTGSWSQVHAGFDHSLAIQSDNTLYAWGGLLIGQGLVNQAQVILGIPVFSSWRMIAAGLAIRADNTLWSWGSNPGDNTTNVCSSPIQIGTSDWSTIANVFDSANAKAAIKVDGSLWMWGINSSGQLGLNDTISRSSPTQVAGSWLQVDTKTNFTAAINSNRIMYVWGDNTAGQLGDNTTIAKSSPVLLASPFNTTSWTSVTVGESNVAALRSDRIMYTWGLNNFGQLGTNSTINRSNPTLLASPFDTTSWGIVSAGNTHVIALRATGSTIVVFGRDNFGQTGITAGTNRSLPTQIGTDSWLQVSAGPNSTYGIIGSPSFNLYAWGLNTSGQLGLNNTNTASTPTIWSPATSWNEVGAGYALDVTGRAFIWGPVNSGLGNFNFTVSSPVQVGAYAPTFYTPAKVGSDSWNVVDAGNSYSIGIRSDGTLWGWGLNTLGQCGNQSTISISSPVQLNSFSWNAIAAGFDHVLAIRNDTTLWTWGNSNAVLLPVTAQSWSTVAAGLSHLVAIRNDGKLFTWGIGTTAQLGDGTIISKSSPVAIGGTSSFIAVNSGANTSYAKDSNNILNVWGLNTAGQAGAGFPINRSNLTQIGVRYLDGSSYNNITESYGTGYTTEIIPFANTVSNYFNRSTWITALYNSNMAVWYDSDYMCEMWVYPLVLQVSTFNLAPLQVGHGDPIVGTLYWSFGFNALGKVMLYYFNGGTVSLVSTSGYSVGINRWQHIAFTHTNATGAINMYLNGILVTSGTKAGTPQASANFPMQIGVSQGIPFFGYISNLRIVKGNIVYTGNFVPQTTQLTATQSAGVNTNAITAGQTSLLLFNDTSNVSISNYTQFDGGKGNHTLALQSNNTLWAWGQSTTGETGILEPTYSWSQIAGGLALRTDNTLWSWGNYAGDNTTVTRSSPIQIGTNEWISIPSIYDSLYVKAAIKTNRTLWMWGDNSRGQLGQSDTINRSSPVQVAGSWNQISVQFSHTAALNSTNIMYVWGNNAFGQLGTNDTINRSSPVLLASPFNTTSWSFVGVGYSHTTALRSDAIIYSWGNNTNGQLGDNTTISKSNPVLLGTGFPTVSWNQISVGALHVLARRTNNILHSWGRGVEGALGDGSIINKSLPVVIGASSWIHVTAGRISSYGISIFGALFSWGGNATGELGLNDVTQRNSPVQIGTLLSYTLTGVQGALDGYGRAYIWGGSGGSAGSQSGLLDTTIVNSSPVIVGGFRYPVNKYFAPQQLGTSSWLQVASGLSYSLAIDANNRLFGWGLNTSGQLGNYINLNQSSPVQLFSGSSWLAVAAGVDHALAIRSDTTLWTWGNHLAIFQNITPTSWSQISGGVSHSLAIRSDGKLYAWGQNNVGQLGINTTATMSSPVLVGAPNTFNLGSVTNVSLSSWSVVSAGNSFSTAIDANNNLYVWGGATETNFQTGDPLAVNRSNPVQISLGIIDTSSYSQETYSYDVRITTTNVPPILGSPVAGEFGLNGNFTAPGSLIPSYIHLNTSFPLRLETNNFTVECWINWQGSLAIGFLADNRYIIAGNTNSGDTTWWELSYTGFNNSPSSGFRFATLSSTANFAIGLFQNRWYHIAAVRISGNVTLYLDGVSVATSAGMSGSISTIAPLRVGFVGANGLVPAQTNAWIGYISNLRIVNGVGVYTGNFTVPTSVLTATQSAGTNIQAITSGQTALLLLTNTASAQSNTFVDVSAGDTHGFAEQANGIVYGWGNNNVGQVEPWGDFSSWNMVSASAGQGGTGIAIRNADKALMVWGQNDVGQLGINNTINRSSPTQLGSNSWLQVNSQGRVTAAIRNDNTLWVWGLGAGGRLAQINDVANRSSPTQVLGSWTSVTIGPKIAAAIRTDGTLWIWGDNPDGTTVQRSSPVQVSGSWSQVTTGDNHLLAINNLGILFAWGNNASGQLGDGTTIRKTIPTLLATPFATVSFTRVAAGLSNSFAIATDGTAYAWGGNSVGELGVNDLVARSNPIAVGFAGTNYGSWTAIAAGNQTAAGVANNNLYFWGLNTSGVYGDNSTTARNFPLQVNIGYSYTSVSLDNSGTGFSLITRSDGALFATGTNSTGGIGDNTTVNRSNPVQIGASFTQLVRTPMRVGSASWSQVRAGTSFTIGVNSIGELYAWGLNNNNNLGLNTTINRNDAIVKITGSSWTTVSAGNFHSLALRSDGTIWTWGATAAIGLSNVTPNSWSQIAESASTSNMAAVRSDGTLFVWGNNNIGQVGDGTTINKSSPTQIGTNSNWAQVELGESFGVARATNGFVYAWGLNTTGQLGDGTTFNRSSPIQVGNRSYSLVTAGSSYALAVSGNLLYAWGINSAGQLGDNTTINKSSPVLVSGTLSWTFVSAGTSHTVATNHLGNIYTWGNNSVFQLGDNTTINKSTPVQVTTNFSFTAISAGANHSLALTTTNKVFTWGQFTSVGVDVNSWTQVSFNDLGSHGVALRSDGSIFTWGLNTSGQLGTNDVVFRSSPVLVQSSQSFIAVGAGAASTYGITLTGAVWGWGLNSSGQLGVNDTINRSSPVVMSTLSEISAVTAGGSHATAIGNGNIYIWGNNSLGQIGDTSTINRSRPVILTSGSRISFTQISAEGNYTLAVNSSGILYAWGQNASFNLGDGTSTNRSNMMQIGRSGFSQISAGTSHAGAITTTSRLSIWGAGSSINLLTQTFSWSQIASSIATATPFTLAIRSDGALYSWGNNAAGQLGDGTTITKSSPVLVPSQWLYWNTVSAGLSHSLAVESSGKIYAWGLGTSGQLGQNDALSRSNPVFVSLPAYTTFTATDLSSYNATPTRTAAPSFNIQDTLFTGAVGVTTSRVDGSNITYPAGSQRLMTGDFTIEFWLNPTGLGSFNNNSLGIATGSNFWYFFWDSSPGNLRFALDVTSTTAGITVSNALQVSIWYHIAVVRLGSTITLYLNGVNSGTLTSGVTPIPYSGPVGNTTGTFSLAQTAGGTNTGANQIISNLRIVNGTALYNSNFIPPREPLGIINTTQTAFLAATTLPSISTSAVVDVGGGSAHTIAALANGELYAFGLNSSGELGNGTTINRSAPVLIGSAANSWTKVTAGSAFSLAIRSNNTLYSWGANLSGQLGLTNINAGGDTINRSSPVQIGTSSWTAISAGASFSTAIRIGGGLFTWGNNTFGQLGLGPTNGTISRSSPVQLGANSWSSVDAGADHALGITSIGIMFGWGLNSSSQIGDNSTINKSSPVIIGSGSWTAIAAGANASYATSDVSLLWVWGNNNNGQLGNYNTITRSSPAMINSVPVLTFGEQIPTSIGTSSWSQISVGTSMTMALRADSTLFTWGLNASGQLGLADTITRSSPVQVLSGVKWSFIQAGLSNAFGISSAKGIQNKLFAWGNAAGAILGFGDTTNRNSPVLLTVSTGSVIPSVVLNNVSFNQISAGLSYSIARRANDNAIMGWNQNSFGQMGDQTLIQSGRSYPVMAGYPVDVDRSIQRWTPSYSAGIKTTDFSPFANQPYDTSTQGGSVEFNGVDTTLSYPYTTLFDMLTNDVSVEVWAYWNSFVTGTTYMTLFGQNSGATATIALNSLVTAGQPNGTLQVRLINDTFRGTWPIETNTWYHLVVTVTSGVARVFANGQLVFYLAGVGNIPAKSSDGWVFGSEDTGRFNGYMSNFRMVIGEVPTDYQTVQVLGAIDQSSFNATITDVNSAVTYSNSIIPLAGATAAFFVGNATVVGSNSYLTIPNAAGFQFGTGDFTVEFFMRKYTTYQAGTIMGLNTASVGNWGFIMSAGSFTWQNGFTASSIGPSININSNFPIDTWRHVAIVRISGTNTIYINGIATGGSFADATNYNGTGILNIGSTAAPPYGTYEGYLSNFRIVKGVGVYTGNFTVPTSPLTSTQSAGTNIQAITGVQTSLLLFTTPASAGTAGVNIFTPPASPLTQTSQGISSAFSTRLLALQGFSTTYNGVIAATGRVSSFSNNGLISITGIGTTGEQGDQSATTRSTAVQLGSVFTGVNLGFNVPVRVTAGSWGQVRAGISSSVALRDDGTVWTWGLNTSGQLGTRSTLARSTPVQVTTLSTSFIDNSSNNQTLTTVAIDASMVVLSPFATVPYDASTLGGSGYFSNGYLTLASNVVLAMSTGDFTCEAWIYIPNFVNTFNSIFSTRASSSTVGSTVVWALGVNRAGYLYFYSGAFQISGSDGVITTEQWYHVAVTRASNSMRLFVNGVQTGSTATTSQNYTTQTATIGANGDGSERFFGYISNLRLVKGQALYTANFTPSTSPLTTTSQGATAGNVSLLTCGSFASTIPTTMNQIAIGSSFTFSRQTSDSSLFAWGINTGAELGLNNTTTQSSPTALNTGQYTNSYTLSPVQVTPGTSNYSQVWAGTSYSFTRTTNGDLYAWGLNTSGQLGLMDQQPYVLTNRSNPTLVNNINYYRVLDVSNNNFIVRAINLLTKSTVIAPLAGSVSLTGFGSGKVLNLLGAENTGFTAYFATTYTIEFWVYVTSYANQIFCAYDDTSRVNIFTNTGTGLFSFTTEATVLTESATSAFSLNTWIHVALVRTGGFVRLYRNGVYTNAQIGSATNYSGGNTFSIGTNNSGTVPFTGYISNFRIANIGVYTGNFTVPTSVLTVTQSAGTNISALTGNQVGLLTLTTEAATIQSTYYDYTSIATGNAFTAGTLSSGSNIQGVGAQPFGQLGLGDTITRSNPVTLASIPILNTYTTSPVQVRPGTSNYAQVFAGQSFSVARDTSNNYFVWGLNTSGQLGINNAITRSSPTLLGLSSFVQVSAGYTHLMAINATNNLLQATGLGSSGQLGLSDTGQRNSFVVVGSSNLQFGTLSPLQVLPESGFSWVSVSAGQSFSLAERSDGTLYTWGLNSVGQIDNNSTINRSSPTLVGSAQTFIDQSVYNKPYINSGVTIETSIRPFVGAVSAYLNGSAQTTMFFNWDTTLNIGTTFCIEGWIYPISTTGAIFSYIGAGGSGWPSYELWMSAGSLALRGASSPGSGSQDVGVGLGTPTLNQWSYFVVRWNAGAFVGYLNGTQQGAGSTGSSPYNLSDGGLRFGLSQGINSNGYFTGYVSNIRIIKGSAGYTGIPVNPTGVLPLVQNATPTQAAITDGQLALFLFTNTSSIANSVTPSFTLISAGLSHATATYTNNNLYTWGLNSSGQLGDNTTLNKVSPVLIGNAFNTATISPVLALSGSWKSISAGASHTMAIRQNDTLWIWGLNASGQAGQNSVLVNYSSPVQVSGSWSVISAGLSYSLATDMNSLLYAWGLGTSNQLGINSATSRSSPTLVSSTLSWTQIAASIGSQATYGLSTDYNYYVWGGRGNALLGDSRTDASIAVPTLMEGINFNTISPTLVNGNWQTVSAGLSHTGAIAGNNLYMWGLNTTGQLGLGATTLRSSPTLVGASLAIRDESVNNFPVTLFGRPGISVFVTPFSNTVSIDFPASSSSYLQTPDNVNLQFDGAFTIEAFVRLNALNGRRAIVTRGETSGTDTGWALWINTANRLVFTATVTTHTHPTVLGANTWYHVAATRDASSQLRLFVDGVTFTAAIVGTNYNFPADLRVGRTKIGDSNPDYWNGYISNLRLIKGTALYTGNFTPPTTPLTAIAGTQYLLASTSPTSGLYSQVFAGSSTTLGIAANNTLFGWGSGAGGEIASYFTTINRSTPQIIGNEFININQSSPIPIALGSWTSISAANSSSAAIRNDYQLFTWGLNSSGQLGLGNTILRSSPTQIGTSSWTQVSAYDTHMIALTLIKTAFTFGLNASGQLGDSTIINKSNPVQVIGSWNNVSAGSSFTGGILSTGSLYMWGLGTSGQIGNLTAINRSSPVQVGTSSWTKVNAGNLNALAIRSDGALFVWGVAGIQLARIWGTPLNTSSPVQIGNQYAGQANSFTQIPFLVYPGSWKAVDAGNSITSAINSQDRLFTWGLNAIGQIDGNNTINRSSPTQIGQNLYLQATAGMSNMGAVGKAT